MQNLQLFDMQPQVSTSSECDDIVLGYIKEFMAQGHSVIPIDAVRSRFRREYEPPVRVSNESKWFRGKALGVVDSYCDSNGFVHCPLSKIGLEKLLRGRHTWTDLEDIAEGDTPRTDSLISYLPIGRGKVAEGFLIFDVESGEEWQEELVCQYYSTRKNIEVRRYRTIVEKFGRKAQKLNLAGGEDMPQLTK